MQSRISEMSKKKKIQIIQCSSTMARGKPICKEIRSLVLDYYKSGKSFGEIAKQLNLSKSSVQGVINNFKKMAILITIS